MGFSNFQGADFKFGSPDPGHPLVDQLAAWAREAASARRVACVYLTASWCPPSVALEKSLADPRMARALRGVNFVGGAQRGLSCARGVNASGIPSDGGVNELKLFF